MAIAHGHSGLRPSRLAALNDATSIDDLEDWEISELFVQVCYDLHSVYQDRGGDWDEF